MHDNSIKGLIKMFCICIMTNIYLFFFSFRKRVGRGGDKNRLFGNNSSIFNRNERFEPLSGSSRCWWARALSHTVNGVVTYTRAWRTPCFVRAVGGVITISAGNNPTTHAVSLWAKLLASHWIQKKKKTSEIMGKLSMGVGNVYVRAIWPQDSKQSATFFFSNHFLLTFATDWKNDQTTLPVAPVSSLSIACIFVTTKPQEN